RVAEPGGCRNLTARNTPHGGRHHFTHKSGRDPPERACSGALVDQFTHPPRRGECVLLIDLGCGPEVRDVISEAAAGRTERLRYGLEIAGDASGRGPGVSDRRLDLIG